MSFSDEIFVPKNSSLSYIYIFIVSLEVLTVATVQGYDVDIDLLANVFVDMLSVYAPDLPAGDWIEYFR